jgi:RNA polymerase sigma-70 factor (ECF subfamily)
MDNDIEKMLIKKALKGDLQAFESLIIDYERKVYNIAFRMFGNEHDANDASQEIFIKVYKNLSKFDNKSSFSTWLHRLAVNTCIDEYRKIKRKTQKNISLDDTVSVEDSNIPKQIADDSLTPEQVVIQEEKVMQVREAINQLKEEHKVIIILRDIESHSYDEIAQILDCSLGTVKSRISRARNALKKTLIKSREQKLI